MPLTPEANLQWVRLTGLMIFSSAMKRPTRQAPRPGRWPYRAHGRYHHCWEKKVSIRIRIHAVDVSIEHQFPFNRLSLWPLIVFPSLPRHAMMLILSLQVLKKRTQRRGHGQSQRDRTPPGHREFSARGSKRPQSEMPLLRRMCGFGGRKLRVRHFAAIEVSLAEPEEPNSCVSLSKIKQLPPKQARDVDLACQQQCKKAQLSFLDASQVD